MTTSVTPPRRPAPRKPSHWGRNASIGVIAIFVLLAALGSAASHRTNDVGPTVPPDLASSDLASSDVGPGSSEAGSPAPPGATLLSMKGTGLKTSEPFAAGGDSVDVTYEYTCTEANSFTLNFYGTSSSPVLPEILASEFDTHGSSTTTESLNGAAGPFTVEVDSPCEWSVEVVGTP